MIRVCSDSEILAREAAALFVQQARESVRDRGRFCVALSGGQTPRQLYEILAGPSFRNDDFWNHTHVFWGDERCVPADDKRNNALMAQRLLLDHVCVPMDQVYPIVCGRQPDDAALQYRERLGEFFFNTVPVFDLILLGLGENGHTASLFPYDEILADQNAWTALVYVKEQNLYRVTLMPALINRARKIVFLISGTSKAAVLHEVIEGPPDPLRLPAQLIDPDSGELIWLADQKAAGLLDPSLIHEKV
jgi:6-phosphogluconolactonase